MMRWANASRGALNRVLGGGNSCICYFLGDATLQTDGFWPCGPCLDWLPAGQTPRGVWRWFRTLEPPPPLTSCPPKTLDLLVRSFRPQDLLRGELSATKERLQTCGAQTSSPGPEVGEWFLLGMCEGG